MAQRAALAAGEKRGERVVVLNLTDISTVTDYFVITAASSEVQVRAIASGVEEELAAWGIVPLRREGLHDARWVLLDYGDVVVHIFRSEEREYYDLERLWGDAPRFTLTDAADALVPD